MTSCYSVLPLTCRVHWLGFWIDIHLALFRAIFIPAQSDAAVNRAGSCWRSCSEDASSTKSPAKRKGLILQLTTLTPSWLGRDCLSISYRPNKRPYSNRIYLNKTWGCVILRKIVFLLNICWSIPCLPHCEEYLLVSIKFKGNHVFFSRCRLRKENFDRS